MGVLGVLGVLGVFSVFSVLGVSLLLRRIFVLIFFCYEVIVKQKIIYGPDSTTNVDVE